jgi:hypothetical protein
MLIFIPTWIPVSNRNDVCKLMERQRQKKADLRYFKKYGTWPNRTAENA